jgi:hypothetical protein
VFTMSHCWCIVEPPGKKGTWWDEWSDERAMSVWELAQEVDKGCPDFLQPLYDSSTPLHLHFCSTGKVTSVTHNRRALPMR